MTDKTMRRLVRAPALAATPLAAALLVLPCAMPAEAGWLARGTGIAGTGNAVKENLEALVDSFGEMTDAVISGDSAKAAAVWEKVKVTPGRIIKERFPVLKLGDAALAAKEGAKDRLKSAERRIGRFVRRTGEAAADVRAALAIGKSERDWYESGTGLLAKALPPVRVAAARIRRPLPKSDPWGAAPTAAARSPDPWSTAPTATAPTAAAPTATAPTATARSPDPWGAAPTAAAPTATARSPDPWSATGGGGAGRAALPSGQDSEGAGGYRAALGAPLGDDPTTGSGDYRAALDALEIREAEQREAKQREAERRVAERRDADQLTPSAAAEARRLYGPCGVSGKEAGDRAEELFAEFDRRIAPDSSGRVVSARGRVCHHINVLRVTRWVNEECLLHGPLTPTEKAQVQQQIAIYDQQIADLRRTDSQLGSTGAAPCACWWATACPDL